MANYYSPENRIWLYKAVLILCILQPVLDVISYWLDVWKADNTVTLVLRFILLLVVVSTAWQMSRRKKVYLVTTIFAIALMAAHIISCRAYWGINYNLSWAFSDVANYIRVLQIPYFAFAIITFFIHVPDRDQLYTCIEKGFMISFMIILFVEIISSITGTDPHTYPNKSIGVLGWFYFANSQSAILCALIPIMLGFLYRKGSKLAILIFAALSFSVLFLFGTRLTFLGIFIIGLGIIITLLFAVRSDKKRFMIICMIAGVILSAGFFHHAPFYRNQAQHHEILLEEQEDINQLLESGKAFYGNEGKDYLIPVYEKYLPGLVHRYGFDSVASSYEYSEKASEIIDWRRMKLEYNKMLMAQTPLCVHLFGLPLDALTYEDYIYDVENDWHGIYYLFGLSGLILMACYIMYFLIMILRALFKDFKGTFSMRSGMVGISIIMLLIHVYFTAGVLRRPNASFYVSVCLALSYYLIRLYREDDLSEHA